MTLFYPKILHFKKTTLYLNNKKASRRRNSSAPLGSGISSVGRRTLPNLRQLASRSTRALSTLDDEVMDGSFSGNTANSVSLTSLPQGEGEAEEAMYGRSTVCGSFQAVGNNQAVGNSQTGEKHEKRQNQSDFSANQNPRFTFEHDQASSNQTNYWQEEIPRDLESRMEAEMQARRFQNRAMSVDQASLYKCSECFKRVLVKKCDKRSKKGEKREKKGHFSSKIQVVNSLFLQFIMHELTILGGLNLNRKI